MADHMKKYALPNEAYDICKWVGLIFLPALGLLVATLGDTWGIADIDKWVQTIDAIGIFIGALIGYSQITAEDVSNEQ